MNGIFMLQNEQEPVVDTTPRTFEPDYPGKRNPWCKTTHPKNHNYIDSLIKKVDEETVRPVKYPEATKLKVYELRAKGYTLRQIAEEVNVSKSTCCLYLQKASRVKVRQPGTDNMVTTDYSVQEVDIGKIKPAGPAKNK